MQFRIEMQSLNYFFSINEQHLQKEIEFEIKTDHRFGLDVITLVH